MGRRFATSGFRSFEYIFNIGREQILFYASMAYVSMPLRIRTLDPTRSFQVQDRHRTHCRIPYSNQKFCLRKLIPTFTKYTVVIFPIDDWKPCSTIGCNMKTNFLVTMRRMMQRLVGRGRHARQTLSLPVYTPRLSANICKHARMTEKFRPVTIDENRPNGSGLIVCFEQLTQAPLVRGIHGELWGHICEGQYPHIYDPRVPHESCRVSFCGHIDVRVWGG